MDLLSHQEDQVSSSYIEKEVSKRKRSIRKYDIILGLIVVFFGMIFFGAMEARANSGGWILPLLAFSLYCTSYLIFSLTGANRKTIYAFTFASMLTSFVFTLSLWHIVWVLAASALALRSLWQIRRQLFGATKINVLQAANAGIASFVFAVSLLLASQHHSNISSLKPTEVVNGIVQAQVKSIKVAAALALKLRGESESAENPLGGVTVDDFLKKTLLSKSPDTVQEGDNENTIPSDASNTKSFDATALFENAAATMGIDALLPESSLREVSQKLTESSQSLVIDTMREQLAEKIGIDVTGTESLFGVLTQATTLKAQDLINNSPALKTFLPLLLSTIFFLTVFSIGSILRMIWTLGAALVFWILRTYGFVKIIKVQKVIDAIKY